MSKLTDRVESDEQNNKEIECLSNSDELLIRPANAIASEAAEVGLTALLSIKEELVDAETASTPFDMKLTLPDEHNASFSSADQEELRKSPRKATGNSRKNSINNNDSLNSSKRSINSSRKNSVDSVRKASTEFNGKAVDISAEIEVSFLEDNEFLSSSSSALVTFDIGKVPLSLEKKSNILVYLRDLFQESIYFLLLNKKDAEKEKIEKETWDKICSLNNSFNKSSDAVSEEVERTTTTVESEKKANCELAGEDLFGIKELPSDVDSQETVKDKNIVNKENTAKTGEGELFLKIFLAKL